MPGLAREILDRYWLGGEKTAKPRSRLKPAVLVTGSPERKAEMARLLIASNFVEVWLAKEGHGGPIGVNYLEKIQLPRLPEMFGAMLAGVDYVLMGAGIPNQVPEALDAFAEYREASYRLDVVGSDRHTMWFDPTTVVPDGYRTELKRPKFLAIVSHHALAQVLTAKAKGEVNGFVVEGPMAGGHNAPARGKQINERGEPIYGERDEPDLAKIRDLGRPFWLAGGYASPEKIREAKQLGATGVQVGSAFAFCDESGLRDEIKRELRRKSFVGDLQVLASSVASPSGFPFQVAELEGTLSDPEIYEDRKRDCGLGYLVVAYEPIKGRLGFRCPAEPIAAYEKKGGNSGDAERRVCICTGLSAAVNDGQSADGSEEAAITTLGQDQSFIHNLLQSADGSYSAHDVVSYLLPSCRSE